MLLLHPRSQTATLLAMTFISSTTLFASPSPVSDERTHTITADDYASISNIGHCVISPDGSQVVYTEWRWEVDRDARNTDLWMVKTSHPEKPQRLTYHASSDGNPTWDPNGNGLYFTSARKQGEGKEAPFNGKTQVFYLTPETGAIRPVTREANGIQEYHLSADGRTLYYTVGRTQYLEDRWTSMRKAHSSFEFGHGLFTASDLFKVNLETWRKTQITTGKRAITAFAPSPNDRWIAMLTTPDDTLVSNEGWSEVDLYDSQTDSTLRLPSEQWREQAPSPYGWIQNPCWSDDSTQLSFRVDFDGYPFEIFTCHMKPEGPGTINKIQRPEEVTATGPMGYHPGSHNLCFTGEDHARNRVYMVSDIDESGQGESTVITQGDAVISDFSWSKSGALAVIHTGLTHPPDVFVLESPGIPSSFKRLTRSNPQVDTWQIPSIEIVKWTSPDGTPVEGILELPPNYQEGTPIPMLVAIHGGPTSADTYAFRYWIYGRTLFAAKGWATFCPNYRGSTGYGDKFLTDLVGNKNNLDVQDILSGVDALVERGIADPDKLAVSGWSNGGYLTNCLITHTQRFKAASSGAGVFDTVMQWETEDTPGHVVNFSEGLPWEKAAKMHETSPLYRAHEITTPTLIHVGEFDARVPAEHSRALHRSLYRYLKVPTELIVYPGAGHGLIQYSHRSSKLKWDVEWIEHYVLGRNVGS